MRLAVAVAVVVGDVGTVAVVDDGQTLFTQVVVPQHVLDDASVLRQCVWVLSHHEHHPSLVATCQVSTYE